MAIVNPATCPYPTQPNLSLPLNLRQQNWVGYGGGSCVHASLMTLMRQQGLYELADWWGREYNGPEDDKELHARLDRAGLRYACTTHGDVNFIDWCCQTRRYALVNDVPGHVRNIIGIDPPGTPGGCAYIVDNNYPGRTYRIPREQWIRQWRSVSGWATTLVYRPLPATTH
jgi:hypothetical protein